MIKHLFNRAKEVIRAQGVKAYILHIKNCLYLKPFIDETWYMLNYFLSPSRKIIKKVQGSNMILDLSDKGINRDLFLYRCREPECTKIFKDELSEGMKVVDIGANIGYYVMMEAKKLGVTGKIYAIEPAPKNFQQLKRNVEINSYPVDIELHNLAIGDRNGRARFSLAATSNNHKLAAPGAEDDDTIEVDVARLDDLLMNKQIDVVRMDPEGAEWLILKGMEKILRNKKPLKMFIEIHPKLIKRYGGDVKEMLVFLADCGFRLKYLVVWKPDSHYIIPYIKGRGALERRIRYDKPLKELLEDEQARDSLICDSGHRYEAGYKVFLERN